MNAKYVITFEVDTVASFQCRCGHDCFRLGSSILCLHITLHDMGSKLLNDGKMEFLYDLIIVDLQQAIGLKEHRFPQIYYTH